VVSPEKLDQMQAGWVRLLARFDVTPADAYPVFDRLVAAHTELHRHYHTLEHLTEMFKVAGKLGDVATDPTAVHLAIWFHDAVYDPKANDNEARSADLAVELLRPLNVPDDTLRRVSALIRATAHSPLDVVDADTAVLLDADLAILSAEPKRYARYAADVRKEYAWVPDDAYRQGRAAVLTSFLDRPRIYRTERMFAAAEPAARANLEAEIASLRGNTIPSP
jgi:predicted metal-dependent HD superfamily phosphohydrolase